MSAQVIPLPGPSEPTVAEIVAAYLDLEGPELAARSLYLTRRYLGAFCDSFGDRPVSSIRRSEFKAWLRAQSQWPAAATRKLALNRIKACLNWAFRDERIASNPLAGLGCDDSPPRREMTDAEYNALFAHA